MVNRGASQNMAIKNKRGIFFTSLVLVILTLFLLSYTFFTGINERQSIQKRVESMNSFLNSLEKDIPRQLRTSGFRIIFLLEKRIIETGEYIDDIDMRFNETFFEGSVYGEITNETLLIMEGATFSGIIDSINEKASKVNVVVTITDPSIEITQDDPWNIKVIFNANLSLQDQNNLASWNKIESISAYIPIKNFEDPIYPVETGNPAVTNVINITPYDRFNSSAELIDHATNSYYLNNTKAPSFLDRLEGNLTVSSPYGIESLAVTKLTSIPGVSIVDYEYFSGTPGQTISGLPSWFIIDTEHINTYRIS